MEIEEFGYKQELKRSLTLTDLVVYGMIFMIPIAPFGVYGYVNAEAPGMVPLAYIIGMVAMLFTALSYGSMAKAFPIAGSVYSYAQRGLNQHVGFIAGWLMLLDYLLIPPLLYVYAAMALNHLYPDIPKVGFILAFLVSATFVNLRGITFTARMNIIFLLAQLVVLGIFLFYAWNALHNGGGNGELTLAPLYHPETFNFALLMQAVSIAVLSFLGFDAISTLAEEIKGDPGSSVGRAALITLVVMGVIFGLLAGYFGGIVDAIIMRVVDIMLALPSLLLALVLVAVFGPSIVNASLALTFVALPHYVRLTRAAVLVEVNRDYVTASRVAGASAMRQMFINILPNCLAPLIVQASLGFSNAILDMAALGFLGMGAQPPTPEWGTMLSDVLQFAQSAWWVVTFPGVAILLTVLAFNLMGDGLRDALDPKLKQ